MKTPLSDAAILYTWDQIFHRLGIKSDKNYFWISGKKIVFFYSDNIESEIPSGQFALQVLPCSPDSFELMINDQILELAWLSKTELLPDITIDFPFDKLPVLFWGNHTNHFRFAEIKKDNHLIVYVDLIASAFFMLSRMEEYNPKTFDKHGRFPFSESASFRYGFIDLPIVDLYVKILKYWLEAATKEILPDPNQFRISISHDLDYISLFRPVYKGISTIAKDGLNLNIKNIHQDLKILFRSYSEDPFFSGINFLAEKSAEFDFSSTFNIMSTSPSLRDSGYSLSSPLALKLLDFIDEKNHQIGLHASYLSFEKPGRLVKEKSKLEKYTGRNAEVIRSHFLRIKTPESWNFWQIAGFKQDTSYGFSEHEGFRCGTCFPYYPFDISADKALNIIEEPLIVMDTTLKSYRKLSIQESKEVIIKLAKTCKFVGGNFTILWHNTTFFRNRQDWGFLYTEILSFLQSILTENQDR